MGCDVRCPTVSCPKPDVPKFECGGIDCPKVDIAGVKCGDVKAAEVHCPTINFPGLKCEPSKCPDINFPEFNCPSLTCTDLTIKCPQCIDNSLGIVIMVTVLVSLALILVFIYKMKQSHDRDRKYRNSNIILRKGAVDKSDKKKRSKNGRKSTPKSSQIEAKPEEVQALDNEGNREFDFEQVKNIFNRNEFEEI